MKRCKASTYTLRGEGEKNRQARSECSTACHRPSSRAGLGSGPSSGGARLGLRTGSGRGSGGVGRCDGVRKDVEDVLCDS